jgi:hypothetical protein
VTDTLDIAILHRPGKVTGNVVTMRRSVDFLVDGLSLFEATKAYKLGLGGCFLAADGDARIKACNQEAAGQFTFERPAPEIREMDGTIGRHRVMLFVCSACGDLGCGAITAEIARDGEFVVWSRFAYQNNYCDADGTNWDDFEAYKPIGPFRFAWDAYKEAIQRAAVV